MFSLMLFIFLCFLGMLAVQFYMLRSQERLNRALRDEHAQMRVLLRAMEARLDALGCPAPKLAETAVQATPAAQDPLLHLSFDRVLQIYGVVMLFTPCLYSIIIEFCKNV